MESKFSEFNRQVKEILDKYNYVPPDIEEALRVAKNKIDKRNGGGANGTRANRNY